MFKIKVEEAIKLHENLITVSGICENKKDFTNRLVDNDGNIYEAHIPFVKTLTPDDTGITLGITGKYEAEPFLGKILLGTN